MKEFLVKHCDKWVLWLLDSDVEENSYRVAVPSGATFYAEDSNMGVKGCYFFRLRSDDFDDEAIYLNGNWMRASFDVRNMTVLWQRSETESLNDQYAEIEKVRQDTIKVTVDELKHRVYKKDVSHLDYIDVYRVLELFNVQSHAVGHAIKKLLCSGGRGAKDEAQDIQEAIDSLIRYQEMEKEDE